MEIFLCLLRFLSTIGASSLLTLLHAAGIEHAANYLVTEVNVFYTTATEEHYRVFLEVVSHSRDVGGDFHTIGKADTGNLPNSGVRLTGGFGGDLRADASLERSIEKDRPVLEDVKALRERRSLGLVRSGFSLAFDELVDGRHTKMRESRSALHNIIDGPKKQLM